MAALIPPPNTIGVNLPPVPHNPAILSDITNAKEYTERLSHIKCELHNSMLQVSAIHNLLTAGNPNVPNASDEIGAARAYESAVIFSHNPGPGAAPAWLAQLVANIDNMNQNIANMNQNIANMNQNIANMNQDIANTNQNIANMNLNMDRMTQDIAALRRHQNESPIILSNATAGPAGILYNPTILLNGWAPELAAPNPRTRDELMVFTGKFSVYT